jgi:hypothetical protein
MRVQTHPTVGLSKVLRKYSRLMGPESGHCVESLISAVSRIFSLNQARLPRQSPMPLCRKSGTSLVSWAPWRCRAGWCDRRSCPVAGDASAHVCGQYSGLAAEHWDDGVVDVGGRYAAGAEGEQQVCPLAGAPVGELRPAGAGGLPRFDGLAEDRVDRLGERGAGLCARDVEQADRVTGQDLRRVPGDRGAVVLLSRRLCSKEHALKLVAGHPPLVLSGGAGCHRRGGTACPTTCRTSSRSRRPARALPRTGRSHHGCR